MSFLNLNTNLIRILSVLGLVIALAFLLDSTDYSLISKPDEILFEIFIFSNVASPYLLSFILSFKMPRNITCKKYFTALVIFTVVGGLLLYLDGLIIEPDAQSALLFVFIPLYQLAVIGISYAITSTVGGNSQKKPSDGSKVKIAE